jgi:DNA repair protein RadA/Sms
MALAIASSFKDVAIDPNAVIIGEVGLNGEIRQVSQIERRITEAERHGFTHAIVPKLNGHKSLGSDRLKIFPVDTLMEAVTYTFPFNLKKPKSFKVS